jgi:hypothetical protein
LHSHCVECPGKDLLLKIIHTRLYHPQDRLIT